MRLSRRLGMLMLGVILVGAIGVAAGGAASPSFTAQGLTADSTFSAGKSNSAGYAKTDPSLLGRTDSTPVNVMIKYDFDATASYAGGVAGLEATSPSATGKSLKQNAAAVSAYEKHTNAVSDNLTGKVEQVAPSTRVFGEYLGVYGGIAAKVPADKIGEILAIPGVEAVQQDSLNQPLDDNTSFIGATTVWPTIGGSANAGSNVIVGDIDTGIWPEHPMMAPGSLGAPAGGLKACQFGNGSLGPAFTCNNKLIGAYAKTATYM